MAGDDARPSCECERRQPRLRRRQAQGLRDQIAARDQADSSRTTSPLVVAPDAHVIDSSNLTIDEVVAEIVRQLKMKGLII